MKNYSKLTRLALAATLALGASSAAHAATYNWSGATNGNMSGTTANWGGTVPTAGDVAQWNSATYTNAPTANANMAIGQMFFTAANTGGVTFGAGTSVITIGHTSSTIGIDMISGSGAVNTGGAGFAISKDQIWRNSAASLLTIGGNITNSVNNANRTLTLTGTGNMLLSGVTSDNTASGKISITKAGSGTLTLSNANTYTGTTSVNAGTLTLDFTTVGSKLSDTSVLALGGGTLNLANGASAHNEVVASTTLNAGLSNITSSSGTSVLRMNAITRNTGSVLNLGAASIADTDTSNANGILGGWATINGTDWATSATSAADTAITAYTGYTNDTWAAANNVNVTTSSAPTSGSTANSLRFNAAGANTVTLAGTNTLTSGGLLVTSAVGNNLSTITGGTLQGASGKDLVVIQNNTANGLTIASIIANNTSATALTKAGDGLLTLSNSNTFTGGVFIGGGTVLLNIAGALNSTTANAVTFTNTTGTLTLNGNSASIASLASSANLSSSTGIIVQNDNNTGATLTTGGSNASTAFYGVLQNGTGTGKLALTKQGTGTFTLYGANTIGDVTVSNGNLYTENSMTFGNLSVASGKNFQFGASDVAAGYTINIDGLTGAGTVTTGVGGGYERRLTLGNNNATADFSGVIAQATNRALVLTKLGSGTQTLSGSTANTQGAGTGVGFDTYIQAGTMILNKTAAIALPGDVFINGGTLQLSGTGDNQIADAAAVSWSSGTFDLNGKSETIGALTVSVLSASANQINVAAGQTFTTAGNVNIFNSAATTLGTSVTFNSAGSVPTSTYSVTGANSFIFGQDSTTSSTTRTNTLDMRNLGVFNAGTSGTALTSFVIGNYVQATGSNYNNGGINTAYLAPSSTIYATSLGVGEKGTGSQPGQFTNTLFLGSDTTALHATTVTVGETGAIGSTGSTVKWDTGDTTGALTLNGTGAASAVTDMFVGYKTDTASSSAGTRLGTVDFSNGTVTGEITNLYVGYKTTASDSGTGSPATTGVFKLGAGVGGASSNLTVGNLTLAYSVSTASTRNNPVNGTFQLDGGTVSVTNNVVLTNESAYDQRNGTLTINGGVMTIGGNITSGITKTTSVLTLSGGTLDMTGGTIGTLANPIDTFTINPATAAELKNVGTINGTAGITKTGAGTLTLNANNYTGVTAINAGTVQIDGADDLGDNSATNTISLNTGTLRSTANSYDLGANRDITLAGAGIIQSDAGTLTVSGDVTNGANGLTLLGAGQIAMTGVIGTGATPTGGLTIGSSTVGADVTLSNNNLFTGNVSFGGSNAQPQGKLTITHSGALGVGPKTVTATSSTSSSSGIHLQNNITLAANLSFTTSGYALTNDSGNNTVDGNITMASGNGNTFLTSTSGLLTLNGTFTANTTARNLQLLGDGDGIINGIVSNGSTAALEIRKNSGAGTWTLTGANTNTGATTISVGTLRVGAASGAATSGTLFSSASITNNAALIFRRTNTTAQDLAKGISGTGSVAYEGSGVINESQYTVNDASSYEGGTTISNARAAVTNATGFGTNTVVINSGGQAFVNAAITLANDFSIAGDGWLETAGRLGALRMATGSEVSGDVTLTGNSRIAGSGTLSGNIGGGFNLELGEDTAIGTVIFSGNNNYTGTTTVSYGTLQASHASALGGTTNGTSVTSGAALAVAGGVTISGETITINGTGTGDFAGSLKAGTGGGTWAGQVILGATTPRLGAIATETLTITGSIVDGSTNALYISGLSGTGVVVLNPTTTNAYTGSTNILRGILQLGKTDALPTGTTLDVDAANGIGDAVTFDLAGFNQTVGGLQDTATTNINGIITNSVGSTTSLLTVNQASNTDFGGVIQNGAGTVALTKDGAGTLTLSGTHTYTGATTVTAGTLALGSSGSLSATSGVNLAADAVLNSAAKASFAMPATQTFTITVNGAGVGSAGRITAAGLDITSGVVTFNVVDTLDDAAYIIGSYTSKTGAAFASVTPPTGYTIDYNYAGGTQIALVPASGFDTWIDDFPGLSDVTPGGDPDSDGMENVLEYVLNGHPGVSDPSILPVADATTDPANIIFTFTRREESANDTTQVFQHGSDLAGWTDVSITGIPGPEVNIGTPSSGLEIITITIPKGSNTSLFGRLKVTQP